MTKEGHVHPASLEVDSHISATIEKMAADFPEVPAIVIASHMTFVRAHAVYGASLAKLYEGIGLSVPRFNMLWLLYRTEDNRLAVSELAAHLGVSIPSVLRMVTALEADDWVMSSRDGTDRRVRVVELTDRGLERVSSILPRAFDIWDRLWGGLSNEQKSLLITLLGSVRRDLLENYIGEVNLAAFRQEDLRRSSQITSLSGDQPPTAARP